MAGRAGQARNANLADRIAFVGELLARCHTKGTIKRLVRQRWGDLDHGTIERYMTRARQQADAAIDSGHRTLRTQQLEFYRAMMRGADSDLAKIKAAERFDRLRGDNRALIQKQIE